MRALRVMLLTLVTACGGNAASPEMPSRVQEPRPSIVTPPSKPHSPVPETAASRPHPSETTAGSQKDEAPKTPHLDTPPTPAQTATVRPEPDPEPVTCESRGLVTDEDGRACREKRFADYCRAGVETDEEEQLTVSRILNGLQLSDCLEVERYLERQPTLILPPRGQKITDLRPIGTLKMLRVLHIANNRIVDVSPLAALDRLEVLNLRHNAVSDLSPLVALKKLRRLDVSGNDARDLSPLAKMPQLTRIQTGPASDPVAIEKREPVTMRGISTGTLE